MSSPVQSAVSPWTKIAHLQAPNPVVEYFHGTNVFLILVPEFPLLQLVSAASSPFAVKILLPPL